MGADVEWGDGRTTADLLGVSQRTLSRWRKEGYFKVGTHWRRKFPSGNSPVLYHLPGCSKVMSEMAARTARELEVS